MYCQPITCVFCKRIVMHYKRKDMKNLMVILFSTFFSLSAFSQTWTNYFSGNTIYNIDKWDSILIVGVENQAVVINTVTGHTSFLRPPLINNYGECVPIRNVVVDTNYNFWIDVSAYGNGLYKYENSTWQHYSNYGGQYMYIDHRTNNLWVTYGGATGTFDGTNFNSIGNYYGPCIADKFGNLWIAESMLGLVKYDGSIVTVYDSTNSGLPNNNVTQITVDSSGKVWFSMDYMDTLFYTHTFTIGSFDGTNWIEYTNANSNLPLINDEIVKLEIDTNNHLIIATRNNGLIDFDGVNAVEYNHNLGNFPDYTINAFLIDKQGKRWIGTEYDGLYLMSGTTFTKISTANNPMPDSRVKDLQIDLSGKIWAGLDNYNDLYANQSLVIKDDTLWTVRQLKNGDHPGGAIAICMDNSGNIFVVGTDGLYKFNGSNWQNYNGWSGYPCCQFGMDVDNNGNVWMGNQNYLIKCNGSGTSSYSLPSNSGYIDCITADNANNIWVGTNWVILKFDGIGNWIKYDNTNTIPELIGGARGIAFDSNGVLWAAGDKLFSFDGITWNYYPDSVAYNFTSIVLDGGENKWVGMVDGFAKYDGSNWMVFNHTNSPIISDYVYTIGVDIARQTIWGGEYCGGLFSFRDTLLIVGLNENTVMTKNENITISPNPTSDIINVNLNNIVQKENKIEIASIEGKLMYNEYCNNSYMTIDISKFPKGIYLIKVSNNKFSSIEKLIKL